MKNNILELISKTKAATSLLEKRGHFVVDDTIGISLLFAGIFTKKPSKYTIVTSNIYGAQRISSMLSSLIGEDNVLLFPSDDLLRTELLSSSKEFLAQRIYALGEALSSKPRIAIVHASSLLMPLPSKEEFEASSLTLKVGQTENLFALKQKLCQAGYLAVNKIDQSLEFASRGDILDIYSVNYDRPIRIEFFGDTVETIKFFDISTQLSSDETESVVIRPATDGLISDEEIAEFRKNIDSQLEKDSHVIGEELSDFERQNVELDYEKISCRIFTPRLYKYYRYIKKETHSFLDYFDSDITFIANEHQFSASTEFMLSEARDYLSNLFSEGRILSHLEMYENYDKVIRNKRTILYGKTFRENEDDIAFDTRPIVFSKKNVANLRIIIDSYLPVNDKIVLAIANKQQFDTVSTLLKSENVPFEVLDNFSLPKDKLGIALFPLEEGFELPDLKTVCVSSGDLFGYHNINSRLSNRYKEATIIKSYEDLRPGDYVVHEYYGIGRFLDVVTMEIEGLHRDFLHIQYAKENVLYVPLSQFRLVRKYAGREGTAPKLSNLNSKDWEKTKTKIKDRINELADRLFKLYSERALAKGFKFQLDDELQLAFERDFPYELTVDQRKALDDIKKDMESDVAMDRLLCGDVGFGKTEVAFCAIFKAISSGKQAAILCPTTLLARQHYERAIERFANFGINIAIVSRLIPEKRQKEYIKDIKSGKIHLVIGTHRLLSKDFSFSDLGLLVIDEEQRFGVEQKERIKELKNNVDVLSLSATPIPRTLQLSLIGVRPVSQIETAPNNRNAIQTYVAPFKKEIARELIERELARQGQVFYVHNVVSTIHSVASQIARAIPTARVGVVHGQMTREEIEDVMMKFYSAEIDVLVATSIIENGIDIPNANLIIIEDADKFGLSQLYQIKGRVGRGNRVAYAYLFYREMKEINEDAKKRLKAIQDFAELGSGYKIAQRDLMIRGAGDILGPEQAGFIDSVGLDLYLKLLNEVVEERKNGIQHEPPKPVKLFSIDAYIPKEYANNEDKIELYQEIENSSNQKELNLIEKKMRDIYGKLPSEVDLLLKKKRIDILLENKEFESVNEYPDYVEIVLSKELSSIDGIGNEMFEVLTPYLEKIRMTYLRKVLSLRLNKQGNWIADLGVIAECIHKIFENSVNTKK